jgi:hypothetical protein
MHYPPHTKKNSQWNKKGKVSHGVKKRIEEASHPEKIMERDEFNGSRAVHTGSPQPTNSEHCFQLGKPERRHKVGSYRQLEEPKAWWGTYLHNDRSYLRFHGKLRVVAVVLTVNVTRCDLH